MKYWVFRSELSGPGSHLVKKRKRKWGDRGVLLCKESGKSVGSAHHRVNCIYCGAQTTMFDAKREGREEL